MAVNNLINWGNLPCEELGNITSSELDFVSAASATDRHDDEFAAFLKFIQEPPSETSSLPLLEDHSIDISVMDRVEIDSLPQDTRKQMFQFGQRFQEFIMTEKLNEIQFTTNEALNQYLRYFYFKLKKQDGSIYSPASLVCIRAGIQRFLRMVLKRSVDIINGEEFRSSNEMLRVKVREFHRAGLITKQYEPIEIGDMQKLACYFEKNTAAAEQDKFLFYVLYCLGERGQEHLQHLTRRDALELHTDSGGKEFYCLPPLPSKNKSADPVRAKAKADNKQARIYDTEKVRRYLDLLPIKTNDSHLFPRPLANSANGSPAFSTKQNRDVNYLVRFMHNLSEKASLSKIYSNHCIRVTRICDLEAAGRSMADIMSITGQTSERTARRYLAKRRDRSLQASSSTVTSALALQTKVKEEDKGDQAGYVRPSDSGASELDLRAGPSTGVTSNMQITGINQENSATKFYFHNCTFSDCKFD